MLRLPAHALCFLAIAAVLSCRGRERPPTDTATDTASGIKPPGSARGPVFNSSQLAAQAAEGELGIALVDPGYFRDELNSGRLLQPFPIIASSGKANYLVYPPAFEERPKVAAFRDWIMAEAQAFERQAWGAQAAKRRSTSR